MLLRSLRVALILVLCLSIGGHWIALQSVAWGTMIVQYSQHTSLAQAVAKTLSGDHPCDLCKGIAAAQHSQKKDIAQPIVKPDLFCAARIIKLRPACADFSFAPFETVALRRAQSPAVPPPRSERI